MTEQTPVSIIIPVYNVAPYLRCCLDSVIAQSFAKFEAIAVDDGSTDGSGAICDEYAAKDKRFVVIHKENGGLSAARNTGLDNCSGRYICFLDSDDYYEPDFLQTMYDGIKDSDYDFVSCVANFVDEENCLIRRNEYPVDRAELRGDLFDHWYHSNLIEDAAWNKIYQRSLFDGVRFKEGIIYEDSEVIVRLLKKATSALFIKEYKYNYRIRQGSILNYQGSEIEKKSFSLRKLDSLVMYESVAKELQGTKYECNSYKSMVRNCAQYSVDILSLDSEERRKAKKTILHYYRLARKNIALRDFAWKERIVILLEIYFPNVWRMIRSKL